VSGIRTLRLSY